MLKKTGLILATAIALTLSACGGEATHRDPNFTLSAEAKAVLDEVDKSHPLYKVKSKTVTIDVEADPFSEGLNPNDNGFKNSASATLTVKLAYPEAIEGYMAYGADEADLALVFDRPEKPFDDEAFETFVEGLLFPHDAAFGEFVAGAVQESFSRGGHFGDPDRREQFEASALDDEVTSIYVNDRMQRFFQDEVIEALASEGSTDIDADIYREYMKSEMYSTASLDAIDVEPNTAMRRLIDGFSN